MLFICLIGGMKEDDDKEKAMWYDEVTTNVYAMLATREKKELRHRPRAVNTIIK